MNIENILDDLWKSRHPQDALFLSIIDGYEIKVTKDYPDEIYFTKNDKILIEYNKRLDDVWINKEIIWSVYENKFTYSEIRELIRIMLDVHLKLRVSGNVFYHRFSKNIESKLKLNDLL